MPRKSRRSPPPRRARPKAAKRSSAPRRRHGAAKTAPKKGFVGRPSSPVLEKYPPRAASGAPVSARPAPPAPLAALPVAFPTNAASPPAPPATAPTTQPLSPAPSGLISLDRPFDVDEFSQSLGETQVRVLVPREDLAEVLRRVLDFMGFGIYVYSIRIAPENSDTLKRFVVELQRVDYSAQRKVWVPFEDKGRADSPFGPGTSGTPT
jgi:hypothetical protein